MLSFSLVAVRYGQLGEIIGPQSLAHVIQPGAEAHLPCWTAFRDVEKGLHLNALRRQGRGHLFLLYMLLVWKDADDWTGTLLRESNIDRVARHHIFPREFLQANLSLEEPETSEVFLSNLANITFIHKDINSEIGDTSPSEYLPRYATSVEKHFIPTDVNLWGINQYSTFLDYRIRQIFAEGKKYFTEIFD